MFAKSYDDLSEQCKHCLNLKIYSARMDGNHIYQCTQYPLHDKENICPCYDDDPTEYK